jgi:uncharacterized membrane protein
MEHWLLVGLINVIVLLLMVAFFAWAFAKEPMNRCGSRRAERLRRWVPDV